MQTLEQDLKSMKLWILFFWLGIAFAVQFILFVSSALIAGAFGFSDFDSEIFSKICNYGYAYLPPLVAYGLILRRFPVDRPAGSSYVSWKHIISCAAACQGSAYFMIIFGNMFLEWTGLLVESTSETTEENMPLFLSILSTVILAPLIEEYIFRRVLLGRLLFLGERTAILISALFFAFGHMSFGTLLYTFAAGLFFGYVYVITGKMRWSLMLHMFSNFLTVLFTFLPDSEWVSLLAVALVVGCMIFAFVFLLRKKPWRNLYPNPPGFEISAELTASLKSVLFWLAIIIELLILIYLQ